jgi:hypothetical protein
VIYLEGGGDSKRLRLHCRNGFRRLLDKCGLPSNPRLVACGSRESAFDRFRSDLRDAPPGEHLVLLIDSEDRLHDPEETWLHLARGGWKKPKAVADDQVLFMTTCMETWIVCDRAALQRHYGHQLQVSALPPLVKLEERARSTVQDALGKATKRCSNAYEKGKRSYDVLGELNPGTLEQHLPSFHRAVRVLRAKS